jgi:hypothetical protein
MGDLHVGSRWRQDPATLAGINDLLQIWTNNNGYLAEIDWNISSAPAIVAEAGRQIGVNIAANEMFERSKTGEWYNPYGERHPYFTTSIPILHWNNWFDPGLCPLGMRDWRHFRSLNSVRDLHYLRANSADHSGFLLEHVPLGPDASPYTNDEMLQRRIDVECGEIADFFDEFINEVEPRSPRPRARWHVGHVGWQESADYPPPSAPRTLHLAGSTGPLGELCEAPGTEATLSWVHDPENPVQGLIDMEALWYVLTAYPDEREIADRPDVLAFRSRPLTEPLDFAGQCTFSAEIELSSDTSYVFVRLQDVLADGTVRPLSYGRAVVHRGGQRVTIALDDNAYRFQAGHCLQLQVSSSDYPHYIVHPGTDESPWFATERKQTTQVIKLGGSCGATLTLPEIQLGR